MQTYTCNRFFQHHVLLAWCTTYDVFGFLGMKIATYANARTTLEARQGVGKAFIIAFKFDYVMGFLLAANGLLVLYITINIFKVYYGDDWEGLFEAITGYGLGWSSMALFGRVGGGIYTKAADVGAYLMGKVERNTPEDDPRNLAVIADNVGDNVGDIAGMGSELFGSYAESCCAALVVASISSFGINRYSGNLTSFEKVAYYLHHFHDSWNCGSQLDCTANFLHNLQFWNTKSCEKLGAILVCEHRTLGWSYHRVCDRVLHQQRIQFRPMMSMQHGETFIPAASAPRQFFPINESRPPQYSHNIHAWTSHY